MLHTQRPSGQKAEMRDVRTDYSCPRLTEIYEATSPDAVEHAVTLSASIGHVGFLVKHAAIVIAFIAFYDLGLKPAS